MAPKATWLEDLELLEVSLVDVPANPHARVMLTKRDPSASREDEIALATMIREAGDDEAKQKAAITRAKALGLERMIPKDWKDPAEKPDPKAGEPTVNELEKANAKIAELTSSVASLTGEVTTAKADKEGLAAKLAEMTTKVQTLEKAQVEKAGDEIIKVAGIDVRKSEVGAANFAIFKAQAEEINKERERTAKAEAARAVEQDLPMLPGEPTAKAEAMMAVAGLPEAVRGTLQKMLAAGNAAMKLGPATRAIGKDGSGAPVAGSIHKDGAPISKAEAAIETAVREHMAKNAGSNYYKSYAAVLEANPSLYNEHVAEMPARTN